MRASVGCLISGNQQHMPSRYVYYQELEKASSLQENKEVRGQKRVLEENVVNEVAKRLKVEEKFQQALAKSEKSSGFYK